MMLRTFARFAHTNAQRQKLLESIVRVDHAGELAADRIYAGQMAVLKGQSPYPYIWQLRLFL